MAVSGTAPASKSWKARQRRRIAAAAGVLLACTAGIAAWRTRAYTVWRQELEAAGFAGELRVPRDGERVLVVAPHPDDEVLGCGGLIQKALQAGAEVYVAIMTNGDASELALLFGRNDLPLGPKAYIKLGEQRQQESLQALDKLGVPLEHVFFLSYPNNGLVALWRPGHWSPAAPYKSPYTRAARSPYKRSFTVGAVYCGQQAVEDLMGLLRRVRPTQIFVTHPQDIHPDHWATERFVQWALSGLEAAGERWAEHVEVYGYLVHWPRWPLPRAYAPGLQLVPPPELVELQARPWLRLELGDEHVRRKAEALWCYRSQRPKADRLLPALVRRNEAFSVLRDAAGRYGMVVGHWMHWLDEQAAGRRLGGADVVGVYAKVGRDGKLAADVVCVPHVLNRRGYVAVDVRGWDSTGQAAAATVYLRQGKPATVVRLSQGRVEVDRVAAEQTVIGLWSVGPVKLPDIKWETAILSCWGSIADRATDPAHWPGTGAATLVGRWHAP